MSQSVTPSVLSAGMLFEQAPHVILVLDPQLAILEANEAGRRFFSMTAAQLNGVQLFDVLPKPQDTGTGWPDRLRHAYAQLLATGVQTSLLLTVRDDLPAASEPALPVVADAPAGGNGLWHVCNAPIRSGDGALVGIATHAVFMEGVESAMGSTAGGASTPVGADGVGGVAVPPAPPAAHRGAGTFWPSQSPAAMPVQAEKNERAVARSPAEAAATAVDTGMRILMVEDNDDLRMLNVDQMEMLGHHVTSAADAEQALRHLETSSFDLLFADLTLPKMSGAELARLVLQQHHPMCVVITSGYGRAMANAQSLDALFLPKPYRFADLKEVLRQVNLRRSV